MDDQHQNHQNHHQCSPRHKKIGQALPKTSDSVQSLQDGDGDAHDECDDCDDCDGHH